jgi:1,4-dihydroxy-2-naphthoate polyprenyltransferase
MHDDSAPSRRELWIHWLVYPGHSLPTAAAPVLVAMALAIHDRVFALLPAVLGFVASWLIHIGGLFTDNYELLARHPGVNEHPELVEALNKGTLTLSGLRWATLSCFALAALTGPYLLHVAGTPVIAIGLLGMAGSLIYSAGPFPFGKLGLSDLHFFIMFGVFAPAAAYYVQLAAHQQPGSDWHLLFHHVPLRAVIVGLPLGALAVNVLIIDDIRDRHFDAAKGWRTGPVRFGLGWSRTEYVMLSAFIYVIPFWFWLQWHLDAWVLLPLITIPFAYAIARRVLTEDSHDSLLPMTPLAAMLCLVYAVLLAIGIAL